MIFFFFIDEKGWRGKIIMIS